MTRRAVVTSLLGAVALCSTSPVRAADAPKLRRGVSLHNLLNWPDVTKTSGDVDYAWPPFQGGRFDVTDFDLKWLKNAGVDFIRLTLDPSIVMSTAADRRPALLDIIHAKTARLVGAGFSVIVDLHSVAVNPRYAPDVLVAPGGEDSFRLYGDAVAQVAATLRGFPSHSAALELMNEPRILRKTELPRWQTMLEQLHARAREAAPDLFLVLTGAQWGSIDALLAVDPAPFRGSNVLYTFHYYDPHSFTHQGVRGEDAQYLNGLRWPGRPEEAGTVVDQAVIRITADKALPEDRKAATVASTRKLVRDYLATPSDPDVIARRFGAVRDWASGHDIAPERIILGEFGGGWGVQGSVTARADTFAWLRAVRTAAEANHFAWAYWAFNSPFPPDLSAALGLSPTTRAG